MKFASSVQKRRRSIAKASTIADESYISRTCRRVRANVHLGPHRRQRPLPVSSPRRRARPRTQRGRRSHQGRDLARLNDRAAADPNITVHWLSLGELSRLIETFQRAGVTQAVMAGQVKHKQIFSAIRPDWRLAKLLLNLRTRNTDMLLGAVAKVLEDEGIDLISSTSFLETCPRLPVSSAPASPTRPERADIDYGLTVARGIAGFDLGQTVVIAAGACVAVEAMEGTGRRHPSRRRPHAHAPRGRPCRRRHHTRAPPHRRQSCQAQPRSAVRCSCRGRPHHRDHAPRGCHLSLRRGRAYPSSIAGP